jgi:hypothetical protein
LNLCSLPSRDRPRPCPPPPCTATAGGSGRSRSPRATADSGLAPAAQRTSRSPRSSGRSVRRFSSSGSPGYDTIAEAAKELTKEVKAGVRRSFPLPTINHGRARACCNCLRACVRMGAHVRVQACMHVCAWGRSPVRVCALVRACKCLLLLSRVCVSAFCGCWLCVWRFQCLHCPAVLI